MDLSVLEASLAEVIAQSAWLAPFAALGGGILTALNPCVLVMVPLIIGVVGGYVQGPGAWKRSLGFSLLFVIGFSLELTVLFSLSAAAAPFLTGIWWRYIIAIICAFLGAHLLFGFSLPAVVSFPTDTRLSGGIGALVLGFLFGLVSMPCSGPVLMLLTSLAPEIGVPRAGTLLFLYGLGHSALILVAGVSVGTVQALADSKGMNRAVHGLKKLAGVLVLGVGLYFLR